MAAETNFLVINSRGESFPSKFMEILDGEEKYDINFQENSARKKIRSRTDIENFENVKNYDEGTFQKLIEGRGGKFVGRETVSGYKCLVFLEGAGEDERKTWYYKGLPLRVQTHNSLYEMIDLKENISIPAEHFLIPDGITIQ